MPVHAQSFTRFFLCDLTCSVISRPILMAIRLAKIRAAMDMSEEAAIVSVKSREAQAQLPGDHHLATGRHVGVGRVVDDELDPRKLL